MQRTWSTEWRLCLFLGDLVMVSSGWNLRGGTGQRSRKKTEWLAQHLVSTGHSARGSSKTWVFMQALQTRFISWAVFLLRLMWKDKR